MTLYLQATRVVRGSQVRHAVGRTGGPHRRHHREHQYQTRHHDLRPSAHQASRDDQSHHVHGPVFCPTGMTSQNLCNIELHYNQPALTA